MRNVLKVVMVTMMLTFLLSMPVYASTSKALSANKTYKTLDLNGDGKKDTFSFTSASWDGYSVFTLNGHAQEVFVARGVAVAYYKYSKSQVYLLVYMHQFGGGTMMAFRYKGNTLVQVNERLGNMARATFKRASGAYVYLEESPYHQENIASFKKLELSKEYDYLTRFLFKYKLNTKTRTFSLASRYGTPLKKYPMTYTGATVVTSSSPKTINKKGVKLKKGASVKLDKIYLRADSSSYLGYTLYLRVKYNGKTGWLESSTAHPFE